MVVAGIITVLALSGILGSLFQPREQRLPKLNENGEALWSQADSVLPYQFYNLNGSTDEVIETAGGILISVPEGSFTDAAGNTVNGAFELEVKEALEPLEIMKAGLETWSDNRLLETGGMFYLNARKDGQSLKIKPGAGVTASIPKIQDREDMLLFDGVRRKPGAGEDHEAAEMMSVDAGINWVNPVKPIRPLLSVAMDSLNFYPPGFEAKMAELGLRTDNKAIRDSVYLSFAVSDVIRVEGEFTKEEMDYLRALVDSMHITDPAEEQHMLQDFMDNSHRFGPARIDVFSVKPGIDPRSVLAFWTSDFNNTILATHTFEERMRFLHSTCDNELLLCYLNNIDKPLYYADSLAAAKASGPARDRLLAFYAQRCGKPDEFPGMTKKLMEVFARKQKELNALFEQTTATWLKRQQEAEALSAQTAEAQGQRDQIRQTGNLNAEFDANLRSVYEQMGMKEPQQLPVSRNVTENYNTFPVVSTGWKNVDKYVFESVLNRSNMSYSANGRTAEITYRNLQLNVKEASSYDILEAYLLPKGFMSFIRMQRTGGVFSYALNTQMEYSLVIIAYRGDALYVTMEKGPLQNGDRSLGSSSAETLNQFVKAGLNSTGVQDMLAETEYLAFRNKDLKRRRQTESVMNIRRVLTPVVYPCTAESAVYAADSIPVSPMLLVQ